MEPSENKTFIEWYQKLRSATVSEVSSNAAPPQELLDELVSFCTQDRFEEVVSKTIDLELLIPTLEIDEEIDFSDITPKFWRLIKQFAPFGPDNMKPVFVTRNVVNAKWSKAVGDGTHLKLDVIQHGKPDITFSGIAFGMGEYAERIKNKEPFDLLYNIEENEWKGNISLQMMVKDLKFV